ncbi:TIGR03086 family metal-binding protein [Streptomyces pseudogriseolus]|uniref:TIGR03086 family metal-binding protein n=1 Tax=Streptomyces pseudogriseolus TaxID=36817 RepID=UPI003FA27C45
MTHTPLDFGPQTRIVARLAEGVTDAQLSDGTPCPAYAVRHVLGHLLGLAVAFRDAGRKDLGATTDTGPQDALPDVGPAWRAELPQALGELAEAWRDPAAWTGMTRAGGVDMPGEVTAAVALDELVVHGWDLARATGQPYTPRPGRAGARPRLPAGRRRGGRPGRRHLRTGRSRPGGRPAAGPGDRPQRPRPGLVQARLKQLGPRPRKAPPKGAPGTSNPTHLCQKH